MSGTNTYTPQLGNWDATWNGFNMGLVNAVDPTKLELITKEIKRGSLGNVPIGDFVVGLKGEIDVEVPDLNVAAFLALCPWMVSSTDQVLIPSTPNKNLYDYAQTLTLHPHNAADQTNDLNFVKVTPMKPLNYKRDGTNEPVWKVSFKVYPDLSQLTASTPKLVYAWLGSATPASE